MHILPSILRQAFYRLARQDRYDAAKASDPQGVARFDASVNARLESRRKRLRDRG